MRSHYQRVQLALLPGSDSDDNWDVKSVTPVVVRQRDWLGGKRALLSFLQPIIQQSLGISRPARLRLPQRRQDAPQLLSEVSDLPNRANLSTQLRRALGASALTGMGGALLFIDLDNFRFLNDTEGHGVGDRLLQQVASCIRSNLGGRDLLAWMGGDEFAVLLEGLGDHEVAATMAARTVAERIRTAICTSSQAGHIFRECTASVGIALFGPASREADTIMKQADLAMYRAKAVGRNAVRVFDAGMERTILLRVMLEDDIRRGFSMNQFALHYQPQVVDGGRLTGAEVLLRWTHPTKGKISPADLIPLAEDSNLILHLGKWVLDSACATLARWARQPALAHLTLSVNVSARQFCQPDFVERIYASIEQAQIDPRRLTLELTESVLLHDIDDIIEKMYAIKAIGVEFALDDFGTGYSSLVYLQRLPLDQLKIDQSFVRDALGTPNAAAIAKAIITLAGSLGLTVLAEGVETRAQCDFLAKVGCHAYQGYYFGRPQALDKFEAIAVEAATAGRIFPSPC